ncbi:pyridoxine 5'-phosphate synthase [Namhaeicola litoreus]|uniref:Pyridoxine 5'-phosphate synthase n=1 Tax=Namhaeicola litoreus TaxID=1052145 RepID=A0ABW3XY72_9FLAO
MTKLSVNINKIATLRNARGGDFPNVVQTAIDLQEFGAQGITVHPRPDERHIRYKDVFDLRPIVHTEFNIEGNPVKKFVDLVLKAKPEQVTLVPDAEDAITSNAGWDTMKHLGFLTEIITEFRQNGIRTSIFLDPNPKLIETAVKTGTDRIELYTEAFAKDFALGNKKGVKSYVETAEVAHAAGLGINAGHDLSLDNIAFFAQEVPFIDEVSIGHALISESLYFGFQNVINMYLHKLKG